MSSHGPCRLFVVRIVSLQTKQAGSKALSGSMRYNTICCVEWLHVMERMMTSEVSVVKIKRLALYGAAFLSSVFCEAQMAMAQGANISIHGFGQGNYSSNLSSPNPDGGDFKWAEERFQLKLDAALAALRA